MVTLRASRVIVRRRPSVGTWCASRTRRSVRMLATSGLGSSVCGEPTFVGDLCSCASKRPWPSGTGRQRRGSAPLTHDSAEDGINRDTIVNMAMTLRLADDETEALRRRAELEHRSMQEVARQAIREYVENHSRAELLDRVLDEELPRYAEALERLGQ